MNVYTLSYEKPKPNVTQGILNYLFLLTDHTWLFNKNDRINFKYFLEISADNSSIIQ